MTESGPTAPRRERVLRSLALLAAAALAPLMFRAVAASVSDVEAGFHDLRGVATDLCAASVVATLEAVLARFRRWPRGALLLVWILLCYGNLEHVLALGSNLAFQYASFATDSTFLFGSLLQFSRPGLLLGTVVGCGALAFYGLRRPTAMPLALATLALGFGILSAIAPTKPLLPGWRQENFAWEGIRWAFTSRVSATPDEATGGNADLDGKPWTELGQRGRNVLLVVVEGVSGAHLESVAAANGHAFESLLPRLDERSRGAVSYSSFVAHQRQTNRGMYALLCGDLPRLATSVPRMTELAAADPPSCLPAVLRQAGYDTVYLQSAPLAFMLKGPFMSRIGYRRVLGDADFETAIHRDKWGVDDRTLYRRALDEIEELRRRDAPYFLTVLTVGTHHPYTVPPDFVPADDPARRAFAYADLALDEFLDELEHRGELDDTLVLLTSDESAGPPGDPDPAIGTLAYNWGYLTALVPGGVRLRIDEPFGQRDLAVSTLDYLGLPDARRFGGRSVFRNYDTPRPLFFGNTYLRIVGMLDLGPGLLVCTESFDACSAFSLDAPRPFSAGRRHEADLGDADLEALRRAVEASLAPASTRGPNTLEVDLVESSRFPLRFTADDQLIFGGQFLRVRPPARIRVELDVEIEGAGSLALEQGLLSRDGTGLDVTVFEKLVPDLSAGERVRLLYHVDTPEALDRIEAFLLVRRASGRGLGLRFHEARLSIEPLDGPVPESTEVHVERFERGP